MPEIIEASCQPHIYPEYVAMYIADYPEGMQICRLGIIIVLDWFNPEHVRHNETDFICTKKHRKSRRQRVPPNLCI